MELTNCIRFEDGHICIFKVVYPCVLLSQLCGCAGRGDFDSRAHVFYSSKQKVDAKVKEFCVSKENCRRQEMLKCVGSDEVVSRRGFCCDSCSGLDCIRPRLRFETRAAQVVPSERKSPRAKKKSDHSITQLKSALLLERTRCLNIQDLEFLVHRWFVLIVSLTMCVK